jgi:hypothetical protein
MSFQNPFKNILNSKVETVETKKADCEYELHKVLDKLDADNGTVATGRALGQLLGAENEINFVSPAMNAFERLTRTVESLKSKFGNDVVAEVLERFRDRALMDKKYSEDEKATGEKRRLSTRTDSDGYKSDDSLF